MKEGLDIKIYMGNCIDRAIIALNGLTAPSQYLLSQAIADVVVTAIKQVEASGEQGAIEYAHKRLMDICDNYEATARKDDQ